MSIDIAYYPHILDLVISYLYDKHDLPTLRSLGLTASEVRVQVKRKLLQHVALKSNLDGISRDLVWNSSLGKARVLDVHECVMLRFQGIAEPTDLSNLGALTEAIVTSRPTVLRFFSEMHHYFGLQYAPSVQAAVFNVDVHDSGFATVYPDDDLVEVCPIPAIPLNILHLRYDKRGMGDFGLAFEAPPSDEQHEVCILIKQYDYGPRPKSPWQSTLLNNLATSALCYLSTHPGARLTLVGMDGWDNWSGSPFPDEEWEPTAAQSFASPAEKVRYCWDWMFATEFGRKYADVEDLVQRVGHETEAEFKERVGEELMTLVLQPPESRWLAARRGP